MYSWGAGFTEFNKKLKAHEVCRKPSNQFIKAKENGLDVPVVAESTRKKLSDASKNRKYTEEYRNRISEFMSEAVARHPESYASNFVCGRTKRSVYNGFNMDSSWELDVAKYLDLNGIKWIKPKLFFVYSYEGKEHKYFPDFYLPDYDKYIEVKGVREKAGCC